jgi:hypothetical protein
MRFRLAMLIRLRALMSDLLNCGRLGIGRGCIGFAGCLGEVCFRPAVAQ